MVEKDFTLRSERGSETELTRTIHVSKQLVENAQEWSWPCQFKFVTNDDETVDLQFRYCDWKTDSYD